MIKFDLHIHSYASKYKEGKNIVDNSTIENAEVLMEKLNENKVGLFSITDHNRFWPELYLRFDELIKSEKYPKVQGIVAGVEFDVRMEKNMGKCHIITIFDANNKEENYQKIFCVLEKYKLEKINDAYKREVFETILKEISLDVILIACQRNSLDKRTGSHNSLSEASENPQQLLMTGYINALEFQRPNVEGILRNNLRTMPQQVLLLTGSDCHDWLSYPNHDSKHGNPEFHLSRASIMPTFKGLLMAVTSPLTRINVQKNKNMSFINGITINGEEIPLVNGINAIIGENGSGKSTILKMLAKNDKETHVKDLIKKNKMKCQSVEESKRLYIGQNEIVSEFENNKLFPEENFIGVDDSEFVDAYRKYANELMNYIKRNIMAKEAVSKLSNLRLEYNELASEIKYFVKIDVESDYSEVENEHNIPLKDVQALLKKLSKMEENEYFEKYKDDLFVAKNILKKIYKEIFSLNEKKEIEKAVKNFIIASSSKYETRVNEAATSREKDSRDYLEQKQRFIDSIIDAINNKADNNQFPERPKAFEGYTSNPKFGFNFNTKTYYHNKDVHDNFLSQMFVKQYANVKKISEVDTIEKLNRAIKKSGNIDAVDESYQNNLERFLKNMCEYKHYLVDTTESGEVLGNTLGEMSLAYFKFLVDKENEKSVFLIDQPEDHISNNSISKKLLSYFNSIRNKKQIVIVTHNPLLVVNLDVDNVIFVKKEEGINVVSGCLELEDNNVNMLDLIANNMDGGRDSIEKRLRVYGKNN